MDDPYSDEIPPLQPPEDASPVHTDSELLVRWRQLMGPWGFDRRSPWLLWFDADGFQLPIVVPVDDIPDLPDDLFLTNLVYVVDQIVQAEGDGTTVAFTLSRPGSSRLTDSDRTWARELRAHADRAGIALRPVHLATHGSVRPLTLDDLGWVDPRSA
jgi:hypothetical protein